MRQQLIDLLKSLEFTIPPPPKCHHAITYARYGSEETGWQDKLALQINQAGTFHCFFLDEEDLNKSSGLVAQHISESLSRPFPEEQHGIAMGQYVELSNGR